MNYRSVVVLGTATAVDRPSARRRRRSRRSPRSSFPAAGPKRGPPPRRSSRRPRSSASRSTRRRPRSVPADRTDGDTPDAELDVWAGHLPLAVQALAPVPDPALRSGIPVPRYARPVSARPGLTMSPVTTPAFDTVVMKFGGSSVADPEKVRIVARRLVDARRRGAAGRRDGLGDGQDDRHAPRARVGRLPRAQPARARHAPLDRRAHRVRARRHGDPRPRRGRGLATPARRPGSSRTRPTHGRRSGRSAATGSGRRSSEGRIVLVAGFQGFSRDTMEITTLGRGGTDATAVALAAALGGACEIYSDVRRRLHRRPEARARGAQARGRLVRRDARDGRLGREGAHAPLGGARTKPWRAHPRALDVHRRGGNLGARDRDGAGDHLGGHALRDGRRVHAHGHPRPPRCRGAASSRAWRRRR